MAPKVPTLTALGLAMACPACSEYDPGAVPIAQAAVPGPDAQTQKLVAAANAFLATLTPAQKAATMFAFTDQTQRQRWSNLPVGIVARAGLSWGEMSAAQRAALMNMLGTVLSPQGTAMVRMQMDADDTLVRVPANPPLAGAAGRGGQRGGGGPTFGSDYYYVSFLGAPSATQPWMLQFGGHHLGINATVAGRNITLSPSLTGGQPTRYVKDGKAIYILENEVKDSRAMLDSLTPDQRRRAMMSTQRIDLVLGPGHDGQMLQPEGVAGSEMNAAQKQRLLALIEARLDILNADDLAAAMAVVRQTLDQTYFAWWGPAEPVGAAYFRVTGPKLAIEFSPQGNGDAAANHVHNMYRDPTNEYGAAWTALK